MLKLSVFHFVTASGQQAKRDKVGAEMLSMMARLWLVCCTSAALLSATSLTAKPSHLKSFESPQTRPLKCLERGLYRMQLLRKRVTELGASGGVSSIRVFSELGSSTSSRGVQRSRLQRQATPRCKEHKKSHIFLASYSGLQTVGTWMWND